MFPFTCLFVDDSKSNSSRRVPLTTTTRVSSGWVASISMRFAIAGRTPRRAAAAASKRPAGDAVLCGRKLIAPEAGSVWDHHVAEFLGRRRVGKHARLRFVRSASPGAATRRGGNNLPMMRVCVATPPGAAPGRADFAPAMYRANSRRHNVFLGSSRRPRADQRRPGGAIGFDRPDAPVAKTALE